MAIESEVSGTGPSPLRRLARMGSDWVDLQWSHIVADLKAVAPMTRGRLLDVGCGDKPYEAFFRPYVKEYIGVEHEATFAATNASHNRGKQGSQGNQRGPDVVYDGRTLPFDDGSFDTVISVQVLEHTPDPQRLVDEMARVLAPDGIVILTAPFSFRLHEEPHDYFRYSPHGLKAMLLRAKLEVVDVRAQGASSASSRTSSTPSSRSGWAGSRGSASRWASWATKKRHASRPVAGLSPSCCRRWWR